MANRSANRANAINRRVKDVIDKVHKEAVRALYLKENNGRRIQMSDRSYLILSNGTYKRLEDKQIIRYSSKRQKVIERNERKSH